MKKFKIYSANYCDFCKRAVILLLYKGAHFEVIDITKNSAARGVLDQVLGSSTVPQIFYDDDPIGGCSDLLAMDESGELDELIAKGER